MFSNPGMSLPACPFPLPEEGATSRRLVYQALQTPAHTSSSSPPATVSVTHSLTSPRIHSSVGTRPCHSSAHWFPQPGPPTTTYLLISDHTSTDGLWPPQKEGLTHSLGHAIQSVGARGTGVGAVSLRCPLGYCEPFKLHVSVSPGERHSPNKCFLSAH